ncbi:VanZ family protein [Actinotalea fermentans]|uniref:VanZ-like domain-containing protein n=1 Tax=Actinotalea fermentans TaxID=43671 RepID=A0A511YV65_9CELL|nr:VanZ family protein [Actinotalea fermentans]KGM16728.1 hypothetical protein N867_16545 [Actinotalea fermentans ATCC 43279 = JCM 9966 = DSM 3133]GEN79077.1 hypothetical protein AFE02nite_08110 [Actinotalea fermentans]
MISTVLVEHPWLTPAALAGLVAAALLAGHLLVPRRRLTWVLVGASLLPVLALTLVPVDRELFATCTVQWALPTPGRVELMANVVLFVAPALLVGVATRRPGLALLAGSGASVLLEAVQALAPAIGRSCDTNDWLSNTLGALVGAALAWVVLRRASASRTSSASHAPHGTADQRV